MDRGKVAGLLLCLLAVGLTALFLWGIGTRAYWAIAVPVALLVVVTMTLLFWVGWTFLSTDVEPYPGHDEGTSGPPAP